MSGLHGAGISQDLAGTNRVAQVIAKLQANSTKAGMAFKNRTLTVSTFTPPRILSLRSIPAMIAFDSSDHSLIGRSDQSSRKISVRSVNAIRLKPCNTFDDLPFAEAASADTSDATNSRIRGFVRSAAAVHRMPFLVSASQPDSQAAARAKRSRAFTASAFAFRSSSTSLFRSKTIGTLLRAFLVSARVGQPRAG